MAGRPRKPTALKLLQGTARADRLPENEPVPPPGVPECPYWLTDDARVHWARLAPIAHEMDCLTVADADAFGQMCETFVEWLRLRDMIRRRGRTYTVTDKAGHTVSIRSRPEVAIYADLDRRLSAQMSSFGLNPAARGRINLTTGKQVAGSDFDSWEERRA